MFEGLFPSAVLLSVYVIICACASNIIRECGCDVRAGINRRLFVLFSALIAFEKFSNLVRQSFNATLRCAQTPIFVRRLSLHRPPSLRSSSPPPNQRPTDSTYSQKLPLPGEPTTRNIINYKVKAFAGLAFVFASEIIALGSPTQVHPPSELVLAVVYHPRCQLCTTHTTRLSGSCHTRAGY